MWIICIDLISEFNIYIYYNKFYFIYILFTILQVLQILYLQINKCLAICL